MRASIKTRISSAGPILLVFAGIALTGVIWEMAYWLVPQPARNLSGQSITSFTTLKERIDAENAARTTLAQILGGTFFLVTAYLTWKNVMVSQEGQITGRFNNAVSHLAEEGNLVKQLGGIYALERIARDSGKDHWPIMEILTACARKTAPCDRGIREQACSDPDQRALLRAIIAVLRRRL